MSTNNDTIILSESYDLRLPEEIRDALQLKPGAQFKVQLFDGHIELLPVIHPRELRGFARGMDTTIEDDKDRF